MDSNKYLISLAFLCIYSATETLSTTGSVFGKQTTVVIPPAKAALCLDIGSHVGIWSKRLSKDFNKVICFEPLQKHIDCHMKNCENL